MARVYIDTPQTNAGDKTYMTNGLGRLDELSPEKSFVSPSKGNDLIRNIQQTRRGNGLDLRTPRGGGRAALRQLPNGGPVKGEFTPLMKSVAKKNLQRRMSGRGLGIPETPAGLRNGYMSNGQTPALPRGEMSHLYNDQTSSSIGDSTPLPQVASSSAQSTPLAQLPGRDGNHGVVGDGNLMTLREQEHIIDKIEKENFGLKMKIHFLEQAMSQSGREFNQAALKENTDLKVNRITMQKELHRFKKNIAQAERDAELYRLQLEEYKERIKRKQADESIRIEMTRLQTELSEKEAEIERLQTDLETAKGSESEELETLRDQVGDLEADVREKDRVIDERDEQLDALKQSASKDSNTAAELEDELETAKRQIEELQEELEQASASAKQAQGEREEALQEQKEAEDNLEELREEMMNKSFTTKGLSRQLEEKTDKLEEELEELQEKHGQLQKDMDDKIGQEKELQNQLHLLEKEGASERRRLQSEVDDASRERDNAKRDFDKMTERLQQALNDLRAKTDEKDLLQTRHDALTDESSSLQRDLTKARAAIEELEQALEEERHLAGQNDNILRTQHKTEVDLLTEQIDNLHREVNSKDSQYASDQDEWDSSRRTLELSAKRAEERAAGLQRTVDKLQAVEGVLSGKESRLQEALESEKDRHLQEEQVLQRQIKELNDDLSSKREASEAARNETANAKEELRISIREQATLREKVNQLEEEIEVLQANLEEEAEFADSQRQKAAEDAGTQLEKVQREKQTLQDQLANTNIELHDVKSAHREAKSEIERLQDRLDRSIRSPNAKLDVEHDRRAFLREKQQLQKDLDRANQEKQALSEANAALEQEINAEIERANLEENRLNDEIEQLRKRSTSSGDNRELSVARSRAERLDSRVKELEGLLAEHVALNDAPAEGDISGLKRDLSDARRKETESFKREQELKTTTRQLRSTIADLEREVHELERAKFSVKSPSASPPSSRELVKVRKELLDTQAALKELRGKNRDLERQVQRGIVDEEERKDLHELVKSSTLEAEALSLKLSDRDDRIAELKIQIKRLREERSSSIKDAASLSKQMEKLQTQYDAVLNRSPAPRPSREDTSVREKEMKGLIKEIHWLRAKWQREVQFRHDLAWSKNFMEMGEIVRSACNEADLNMIHEMGVRARRSTYESHLSPKQKLRAGVNTVIATIRMQRLGEDWKQMRKLGEGLRKAKGAVERRRTSGR